MIAAAAMASRRHDEEMVPVLVRHKIQVLRGAGHSQADVAARTGVSLAAIRRIERESEVIEVDDRGARRERGLGRPSKAQPFADKIKQWLTEEPDTPTLELLRRAKQAGYEGHKSAFYALVAGCFVRDCMVLRLRCVRSGRAAMDLAPANPAVG